MNDILYRINVLYIGSDLFLSTNVLTAIELKHSGNYVFYPSPFYHNEYKYANYDFKFCHI